MALQSRKDLAMVGLGVLGDSPPNPAQPPLVDGIHLRWGFGSNAGFPWYGFYLFRRPHRGGAPLLLSGVTGDLRPGPLPARQLVTPHGQFSSDTNLVLTDDFPPAGAVEFDLDGRGFLRFALPSAEPARRVDVRIGFRPRTGEPSPTRQCVTFIGRPQGRDANPKTEQGVRFEVRDQRGRPRPHTTIRSRQTSGGPVSGLDCEWQLEITLPRPASFVELTLTAFGSPATIEAFSKDGTTISTARMQHDRNRDPETLRLTGDGIAGIGIRARQNPPRTRTLLHELCFGTGMIPQIRLTALSGTVPVAHATASGQAGQVVSTALEFDAISAIELSTGSAALVDLGLVAVSQDAVVGWEPVPGFPTPMRLPVTRPDYPSSPGQAEDLAGARVLARSRIRYGDPDRLTAAPVRIPTAGTVFVVVGSPIVEGAGTGWDDDLSGSVFQVSGDATAYAILAVLAPDRLVLSRGYGGATGAGKVYAISHDDFGQLHDSLVHLVSGGSAAGPMVDRAIPAPVHEQGMVSVADGSPAVMGSGTNWGINLVGLALQIAGEQSNYTIAAVDSPTHLTLNRPYVGPSAATKPYAIAVALRSPGSGIDDPLMPSQPLLDLVLLATLDPAAAQMVGLYWVDGTANPGVAYDYLLVADYAGRGELDAAKTLAVLEQAGFQDLEGYIAFKMRMAAAPPLAPPEGLRAYALPASGADQTGASAHVSTLAGLRWDLGVTDFGELLPGRALLYHLWRADLGVREPASEPPADRYELLTRDRPLLVAEPELPPGVTPQRPADWPPFELYAIDRPRSHGWYSYRVNGIDLFGRHNPSSAAAAWYQWEPPPDPRPPYYQDPPGHRPIHPFALNLPDTIPPPAPTGIEAYALDTADPTVLKDTAYVAWRDALTASAWYRALSEEQKRDLIGLRMRWLWTVAHAEQAPDLREFRIYYHGGASGQMNALLGNVLSASEVGLTESVVETNIANARPAGAYAGTSLQIGQNSFAVVTNEAGNRLRLQVKNVGAKDDVRPSAGERCTVAIPPIYAEGSVSVENGSETVTGAGANWTAHLIGMPMRFAGELTEYTVLKADSPTQLTLDRAYAGVNGTGRGYGIRHPLFVDYGSPINWEDRYHVVDADDFVLVTMDGQTLRQYEVFLPTGQGADRRGLPLEPSRADPVAYAHVGVTAADDKDEVPDDPKWAGMRWGNRPGNEGRLGSPAKIFRVLRESPKPPAPPPDAPRAFATPADYHGRSFYTYRWRPVAHLKTHVSRALDDALFKADWVQRPRGALGPSQTEFFPDPTVEPRWNNAKRRQVANELNRLNDFSHDAAGTEQAMGYYRGLSNDALHVLAGLPGNERAFAQITIQPLDPDDPANADRRGPDSPDAYTPDPHLRAYADALDGRSTNRYFYRAAYVDGAHNRSGLGLSSPPVYLPNVVPPGTPLLAGVTGGDGEVVLRWASNREPDLAAYRIYRSDMAVRARDVRLMDLVQIVNVPADAPAARPPEAEWRDNTVVPYVENHYRITAVDTAGNESPPTISAVSRGYSTLPLDPPAAAAVNRVGVGANQLVRVTWTGLPGVTVLVQRRVSGTSFWRTVDTWSQHGASMLDDRGAERAEAYQYRLRARDLSGRLSEPSTVITLAAP